MKNVGECQNEFFAYLNALETRGEGIRRESKFKVCGFDPLAQ